MKSKKSYKSAKPFFQKILKDKEVRIQFEEEKSKTDNVRKRASPKEFIHKMDLMLA